MKNMFSPRSSSYDLRGNYILSLSKPKTTTYGLNSFSYVSVKRWNTLPDFFRTSFFADFKTKIQEFTYLNLKLWIVNNIFFSSMCLLLLFYYYYL